MANPKEPWLSVILSQIYPGIGQFYAGKKKRAYLIFSAFTLCLILSLATLIWSALGASIFIPIALIVVAALIWIANLFDAHKQAKLQNSENQIELPERKKHPFLAAFLSLNFPGLGQLYNFQILKGLGVLILAYGLESIVDEYPENVYFGIFPILLVNLLGCLDAYRSAIKINGRAEPHLEIWNKSICLIAILPKLLTSLMAMATTAFVVQPYGIPSEAMRPAIQTGDHIFANKFIYGTRVPLTLKRLWKWKEVERGDVVIFLCPPEALSEEERRARARKDFIKRVVGLPGDKIEIKNKALYINDLKADDPYAVFTHETVHASTHAEKALGEYQENWEKGEFVFLPIETVRDNFGPVVVPEKSYFVMGDNRDISFDSRFWGPLPEKYVKSKAWMTYWPKLRPIN